MKFNGLQVCYSLFQWHTSTTNYMCSKVILNLFYIPKAILKLHLDGKLQVAVVYYLYYKRDFSYYQTLWVAKR